MFDDISFRNYFNKKDTEDINVDTAFEVKKMGKYAE
jgi:hypothetical protein